MNLAIICTGSRGDMQPHLALGCSLKRAGHRVTMVTHDVFRQLVTDYGLEFATLAGDPRKLLEGENGRRLLELGEKPAKFFKLWADLHADITPKIAHDSVAACRDADAILCTTNGFFIGEMVAEKLNKPLIYLSIVPFAPTWKQPGIGLPPLPKWSAWLLVPFRHYYTMQVIGMQYFARCFLAQVNVAREQLGLPPRSRWISSRTFRAGPLALYAYSRHVYPQPSDWTNRQQVTGYWFLDRLPGWQPPPKLVDFLSSGPPPVCVGFGSMTPQSPEELARLVVAALKRSKQRGILLSGWSGMSAEELGDDVYVIDAVPHDWLFPQVSAVVHHGGAGTTSAGLRFGKPTVIVPFLGDQPFWARRVEALGVGPAAVRKSVLSAETLAAAIEQAAGNPEMRRRAEDLGVKLRAENGVQTAAAFVEKELSR